MEKQITPAPVTKQDWEEIRGLWAEMMGKVDKANRLAGGSFQVPALERGWEKMAEMLEESAEYIRNRIVSK